MHDLERRVQDAKSNVESISQLMSKWSEAPLYERKEGKKDGLLNLEVKVTSREGYQRLNVIYIFQCTFHQLYARLEESKAFFIEFSAR